MKSLRCSSVVVLFLLTFGLYAGTASSVAEPYRRAGIKPRVACTLYCAPKRNYSILLHQPNRLAVGIPLSALSV